MAIETGELTANESPLNEEAVLEFLLQLINDSGAALNALLAHVGDRVGLWQAMSGRSGVSSTELAEATGTNERMVREWLATQAASGYVTYNSEAGTFSLPAEHATALATDDSPVALAGIFQLVVSGYRSVDELVEAMRTGTGLGWGDHHPDLFEGLERGLAPIYRSQLATEWIAALNGVEARLVAGARVADVGCGHGASTLVMAEAYPASTVTGFDVHEPSIATARERARRAGLADAVAFEVASARELAGEYDLVMFCECVHDMADPLGAARRAGEVLAPEGTVMVVEPVAGDRLEDNLHPLGRWFYAASTTFCTPCSLADGGAALGAQAGEARLRALFGEAGFSRFRRALDAPFCTVYEARIS